MRRTKYRVELSNTTLFKQKLLAWAQSYRHVVWLDSNQFKIEATYDAILAVGAETFINYDIDNAFDRLDAYRKKTKDWIFGYLSYDLKNDIENVTSTNADELGFPELFFFQPQKLFLFKNNALEVKYIDKFEVELQQDLKQIDNFKSNNDEVSTSVVIQSRLSQHDYLNKIKHIKAHIYRGDIYEVNFCQEFFATQSCINPLAVYKKLNKISKPPFAAFLRLEDKYLMSASPERYLKKENNLITSQPIKGTAKRSGNEQEDNALKHALLSSDKERSENIMIVDLVRNDLSKIAQRGSVHVKELCKVYTFDQVHQLISTVTARVDENVNPVEILKSTFPMGSMTGAPKIAAMKIIEAMEVTKRGLYSGALGYFEPNGNFDFNVVIRSILYNEANHYISYSVGGAITSKSDAMAEYNECMLKAKAMREVLETHK